MQITMAEDFGIQGRGAFYDVTGAIRDVIQNHLFQILCNLTMEPPQTLDSESIRDEKVKVLKAIAPLRENIAAALFWALWREAGPFDSLLDPMCGSGTLLLESEKFFTKQTREFMFEKHQDWQPANLAIETSGVQNFYALDKNENSLASLRETLKEGAHHWHLMKRDILKDPALQIASKLAVVCNPPYGERLKLPLPPREFYKKAFEKILEFQPVAVGMILPKGFAHLVPEIYMGYKKQKAIEFKNGGLPVVYGIWVP
jgi:23S rRNA G2445 N2-methylase RlmL